MLFEKYWHRKRRGDFGSRAPVAPSRFAGDALSDFELWICAFKGLPSLAGTALRCLSPLAAVGIAKVLPLTQYLPDQAPVNVRQPKISAGMIESKLEMIQPQLMK
jgi:hypothetical protein